MWSRVFDSCAIRWLKFTQSHQSPHRLEWTLFIPDLHAVAETQVANLGRGYLDASINATTESWGNAMAVCDES